jgi:hypothetical protein
MEKSEITTAEQYEFIFSKENNRFTQIFYKVLSGNNITTEENAFVKSRVKKYFELFSKEVVIKNFSFSIKKFKVKVYLTKKIAL